MIVLEPRTFGPDWPTCPDLRELVLRVGVDQVEVYGLSCAEETGEMVYALRTGRVTTWWRRDLRIWTATPGAVIENIQRGCGCS